MAEREGGQDFQEGEGGLGFQVREGGEELWEKLWIYGGTVVRVHQWRISEQLLLDYICFFSQGYFYASLTNWPNQ